MNIFPSNLASTSIYEQWQLAGRDMRTGIKSPSELDKFLQATVERCRQPMWLIDKLNHTQRIQRMENVRNGNMRGRKGPYLCQQEISLDWGQ